MMNAPVWILGDNEDVCKRFRNGIFQIGLCRSEEDIPVMSRMKFHSAHEQTKDSEAPPKVFIVIPYEERQTILIQGTSGRNFHEEIGMTGRSRGREL